MTKTYAVYETVSGLRRCVTGSLKLANEMAAALNGRGIRAFIHAA